MCSKCLAGYGQYCWEGSGIKDERISKATSRAQYIWCEADYKYEVVFYLSITDCIIISPQMRRLSCPTTVQLRTNETIKALVPHDGEAGRPIVTNLEELV